MGIQGMRDFLAEKLMGWKWYVTPRTNTAWWLLPDGRSMLASDWQPDKVWEQCGMVIDAMREKGYALSIIVGPKIAIVFCGPDESPVLPEKRVAETPCMAVVKAMAMALENEK